MGKLTPVLKPTFRNSSFFKRKGWSGEALAGTPAPPLSWLMLGSVAPPHSACARMGFQWNAVRRVGRTVTFPFQRVNELQLQTPVRVSKPSVYHWVIRFSKQKPKLKKKIIKFCFFLFPIPNFALNWKKACCHFGYFDLSRVTQELACDRWQQSYLWSSVSPSKLL